MSRYGQQLKIAVDHARVKVKARYRTEGAALAGTIEAGCDGFEAELDIKSSAPAAEVARLVRIAENSCFVKQTLANPTPVRVSAALNGQPLTGVAAS